MAIAGANFALMYRALLRRRSGILLRDEEFRVYVGFLLAATIAVTAILIGDDIFKGEEAVRHAAFQVVSTMTTTGMASTDFNAWPLLTLVLLIGLMFIGGSAGSTAGSIKVVRHLLLGKVLRRELDQTVHPEIVGRIRLNRHAVDERVLRAVASFILLYVGLFVVGTLLLVVDADRVGLGLAPDRRDRGGRDDARQRRPGPRHRRADGLVRALQRLLEARDDRADVVRAARDHPDRRALHTKLLARLTGKG